MRNSPQKWQRYESGVVIAGTNELLQWLANAHMAVVLDSISQLSSTSHAA